MSGYDRPLSLKEIAAVDDKDIDFSDIPELGESFWREAKLVKPDRTERITLRATPHSERPPPRCLVS